MCEIRLLAVALALLLAACGKGEEGKPAPIVTGSTAAAETYPVRDILVRWDGPPEAPKPGKKAPRPPDKAYGRTKEQALARAKEAVAKVRAAPESFETVARETSDDEAARVDGGFVGFVSIEAGHVKSLVEAVAALPLGAVGDPIEGENGWHVMQRLPREEGKKREAQVSAVVEGFVAPWHDIGKSLDPAVTRGAAYAAAAKAVTALREGTVQLGAVPGTLDGGQPFDAVFRRTTRPGFEAIARAALELKPDGKEYTDPAETPMGWAVVRRLPYLRARVRQIAIAFSQNPDPSGKDPAKRTAAAAKTRAEEAYAKVKANPADWNALVIQYSDEPETKNRAGLVGDITNADPAGPRTLEEIRSAVSRLAPGEISPLTPSRIGFHILRRDD